MELENIVYQNQDNMGGIPLLIYYFQHEDVEVFPKMTDFQSITSFSDAALLDGLPTMKSGKFLHEIQITDGQGMLSAIRQGEIGGISKRVELDFQLDGISKKAAGFDRIANNARFGFIIPDLDQGHFYGVGCRKFFPASLTAEGNLGTGEGREGKKGGQYKFKSDAPTLEIFDVTDADVEGLLSASS
ncbi:MAG: hypothetical protein K9J21_11870 [Bacteroidales bacterium]|nr:hypothetical protein [Bacteroidales bacterium]